MRRLLVMLSLAASALASPGVVQAHPAPFSYLDLHISPRGLVGSLVIHDLDAARELNVDAVYGLLDPETAFRHREALLGILSPRLSFALDGRETRVVWGALETLPERQSLRLAFTLAQGARPGRVQVRALLFPYDPVHQTFLNVYEDDALAQQAILDVSRPTADFYSGTVQGRLAVVQTFVLSGIEHILIGPDHVLFLIGLLLLRGTLGKLAMIVTAFTVGHSITLTLAALDILSPPSRLIEPLIALTIVVVGADNLFVLHARADRAQKSQTDIRAWLAAGFGLIHGFGFAAVLKQFGLPQAALGWSLFAFNLGVEIGQLALVVAVAFALQRLARHTPSSAARLAWAGSIGVILAGTYWFIQRTFFPGG